MESWAEREVEIACKREAPDREPGEWDYGCACYESALKAFNSLCEDGHSGFSIGMTKQILNRLIECKPLTSIEDTEDVWDNTTDFGGHRGEVANYQCKRMSSLFKYVYVDGSVKYRDVVSGRNVTSICVWQQRQNQVVAWFAVWYFYFRMHRRVTVDSVPGII